MARKKHPLPLLTEITITDVAAEGKALARVNDMVVFVPFAVPGDVVDIQVRKKKKNYCEGEVVRFVKYSENRVEPRCSHFGICGGCKWQNLPYKQQLQFKAKQVYDQLTRISHVQLPEFNPILGSREVFAYRNKLEFGCSNKRWFTKEEITANASFEHTNAIGFHITGAFDKILPIEQCFLMDDTVNEIRNAIRDYALQNNLSFYDLRTHEGLLRSIMVRTDGNGHWMVLVQFRFSDEKSIEQAEGLLQHLVDNFPQITSLLYVDNQKCNDTFNDLDLNVFHGDDHIWMQMGDLQFKVGAKSFYQTNTHQAEELYRVARNFAGLTGTEVVYDLYTGTGTIANFVASYAQKVVGIEYVPEAIEDAKINSEVNHITNTHFFAGDMKDILIPSFVEQHGRPDVIITDPPRAGMHPDVITTIINAAPKRIVYVSCNPATQARDLAAFDEKYKVTAVQPVDMFPHTPHIENVVLLEQR